MDFSPSIAPFTNGVVYLVLDDLGMALGRVWREVGEDESDRETLIARLLAGQYANPASVVAFDAEQGWSKDVTRDVADELWERCRDDAAPELLEFLSRYPQRREGRQLHLF